MLRESALEKRLVREIQKLGGKALKFVSPGNNGVPDRLIILPNGTAVFIEMKAPGKPLEPLQERWARILRRMEHQVYKIDSLEDIERFIEEVVKYAG